MAGRKAGIGKEVLWHAGPAAASAGWDAPFWSLRRTEPLLSMSIPGNEEARQAADYGEINFAEDFY